LKVVEANLVFLADTDSDSPQSICKFSQLVKDLRLIVQYRMECSNSVTKSSFGW